MTEDGRTSEPAAFLGDGRGTVFVDAVEALSHESQRLLLILLERLAEASALGENRPIGRLIAGSRTNLEQEVAAGRFLPQLYDAINKVRVDLRQSSAQQGDRNTGGTDDEVLLEHPPSRSGQRSK